MKTRNLVTLAILLCSLFLAPSLLRADQDDWYQGRQGQWVQHQNAWQFRDRDGNQYRESGGSWRWYNEAPEYNQWYQGRRGQWVQRQNGWRFRDADGDVYRQSGNSWRWYNGRAHGEEGSEYHNRAAGDNRSYNQFQNQERN